MTPTLSGRLQSRIGVSLIGGLPAVLLLAMLFPGRGGRASSTVVGLEILALTIAFGLAWELGYHVIQQFRHDRDWPTGIALVVGIPELTLVRHACVAMDVADGMSLTRFAAITAVVWVAIWLTGQSVMRVVNPFWRFRGGRLL